MDLAQPYAGPLAGQDLSLLSAGTSLLRHSDGRVGTFVDIEADGRVRVQSLKGKGFWIFSPAECEYDGHRGKPLNRRQQAKARTRTRVLTAARALFEAQGYARATIREIATAAGMSTGAVFANFEDKDALWSAVFDGPAPDLATADEIARTLGALPGHGWTLSRSRDGFRVTITTPDFDPVERVGSCFGGRGPSAAAALRMAREAATHAVRPEAVQ